MKTRKRLKHYTVMVYKEGPIFVDARTKSEAIPIAQEMMVEGPAASYPGLAGYGKRKAITDIHETTEDEMYQHPSLFGKFRFSPDKDIAYLKARARRGLPPPVMFEYPKKEFRWKNPRERHYTSPFLDLTRQEKDILIHAKSGAVYNDKEWIALAKGLARRGFVRFSKDYNGFVLTSKGRMAIQDLGLSNPGAAWHQSQEILIRKDLAKATTSATNTGRAYWEGQADAHRKSKISAAEQGIPNPVKKKLPILTLALIGLGIWYLVKKSNQ